ncbi:P-selectin glycoprotein ligand 1 [Phalacrocorax aristotelis]|uniref:P-selectin glycoprotein ligand 1 n=1 Tax=Phalacrocorax aristotelis TaxID=126867 RepID=UPI003F4BBE71
MQLGKATSGAKTAGGLPQGTQHAREGQEAPFWDAPHIPATLVGRCTQPLALGGPVPGVTSFPHWALRNHSHSSVPAFPSPPWQEVQAEGSLRRSSVFSGCPAPGLPLCPVLVILAGAAACGPVASPGRDPMVPGWAVLVMLVPVLVLSTLWACGAVPLLELGQHHGVQWVWGAARQAQAEPLLLSRRKRDDGRQQPTAATTMLEQGYAATAMPSSNNLDPPKPSLLLGSAPPPAPSTNASLHQALAVPTTADPLDETDSPEPDLLLGSAPPPAPSTSTSLHQGLAVPTTADPLDETDSPEPDLLLSSAPPPAPSTSASLHQALAVPTTADPLDETDSPEPDLLLSSAPPPAPSTSTSLHQGLAVPTTADPLDETDSPEPDLLLSSAPPPAPSTSASLHRARAVPTTADPLDETDSPDPDLLQSSAPPAEPGTQAAPQNSITTIPSWLTWPSKEETAAGGTDSSSSVGLRSATHPALSPTTTGYKKVKKTGAPPVSTRSAPWDTKPGGTAVPWDPSKVMSKCLLAILLLALVAATFMVCTGVLGALLWRRTRMAHRRLSHTEMVCISSLLPDGEVAANGPKPGLTRRPKLLLDGSEADGDNLTLSSFLPEHS